MPCTEFPNDIVPNVDVDSQRLVFNNNGSLMTHQCWIKSDGNDTKLNLECDVLGGDDCGITENIDINTSMLFKAMYLGVANHAKVESPAEWKLVLREQGKASRSSMIQRFLGSFKCLGNNKWPTPSQFANMFAKDETLSNYDSIYFNNTNDLTKDDKVAIMKKEVGELLCSGTSSVLSKLCGLIATGPEAVSYETRKSIDDSAIEFCMNTDVDDYNKLIKMDPFIERRCGCIKSKYKTLMQTKNEALIETNPKFKTFIDDFPCYDNRMCDRFGYRPFEISEFLSGNKEQCPEMCNEINIGVNNTMDLSKNGILIQKCVMTNENGFQVITDSTDNEGQVNTQATEVKNDSLHPDQHNDEKNQNEKTQKQNMLIFGFAGFTIIMIIIIIMFTL
jgi:hypothetical protein